VLAGVQVALVELVALELAGAQAVLAVVVVAVGFSIVAGAKSSFVKLCLQDMHSSTLKEKSAWIIRNA
jgi:hypothetical protein